VYTDPDIEEEYYLRLLVRLEDPFTGEVLAWGQDTVMPVNM